MMNHQYNQQNQVPVAYPSPPTSYPPPATGESYTGPYVMAPPPIGYPTRDGTNQGNTHIVETTSRDGMLKGCLAGLCCCWCLEMCF